MKCDLCVDGFIYDPENRMCVDTVCKLEHCASCKRSGLYGCDLCEEGYYFDMEDKTCQDFSCKIDQCGTCDSHPKVCDSCVTNYFLKSNKLCIDGTCRVDKCADCSISGP